MSNKRYTEEFKIEVDAKLSTAAAHKIADQLETLLAEHFDVHDVSIHIEPHT